MNFDPPTIAMALDQRRRDTPDALAFAFGDDSLTYRQLSDDADSLAGMLLHDGIGHGDRVAIVMPAGLGLVRTFYALQRIGAVPCIFDPHVPATRTARRIESIRPGRTLTDIPHAHPASLPLPRVVDDPNAVAFLQQTSGTSGEPLAAVVLQRNVMASLHSFRERVDPGPSDVLVGWVPPWHDLGLLRFLIAPVFFGLPCHLIPAAVKTIPQWLSTISTARGTITGAPDFAWRLATRLVDAAAVDLRTLRWATNGGEPVRASTVEAFESRFGLKNVLCPGYGLAEATLGVSTTRGGDALRVDEHGNVSCGKPLKDVEVRIDADEILVRGPNVFAGYFDAEDATERVLQDGWLRTGDHGKLDSDNNLYVLGRQRAMIKRGGVALAPRELEEAAQSVAGVRLAAAVGVPSGLTEEIVVVVEVEEAASRIEIEVAAAVERAIGFSPDRVIVQAPRTIARTANGKIRHAVLRDQLTPSRLRSNPSVISDGFSNR
ncbi:MAG TPA: AMP-binding protein [Thermoanaerobaculia bacterium]|jgi:acyl-CoA synthetase (AMP-forming)/AMP-acid ligase II|nr:AMP-binding protein [Thermoanaerobaculia bacterium]